MTLLLAAALSGASIGPFPAQTVASRENPDPLTVYMVTAAPGDAIWERFGHNGIWIHDASSGEDVFWEWGLFSFRQEGFVPRLARGTMLYGMGGRYLEEMLAVYRYQDRQVWAQELALTPEQERELNRLVRTNALPENRQYVYDYYTDNCSTRARDALDTVLGGRLEATFDTVDSGATWRWHTRRLLRPDPLAEAGLQVVLGNPGDNRVSAWEEMFLPMRLRDHLSRATVPGPDGTIRPLVVADTVLVASSRGSVPAAPGHRLLPALLIGVLLAGVVAALGFRGAARPGWERRVFGAATLVWSLAAGGLGSILVLAWVFTDHDFWRWNENVFQLNPGFLAVAVMAVPVVLGRAPAPRLLRWLRMLAWISVLALALKLLPDLGQENWEVVAVALPLNAALALAASRFAGRER